MADLRVRPAVADDIEPTVQLALRAAPDLREEDWREALEGISVSRDACCS
jgi:hypothetical protein